MGPHASTNPHITNTKRLDHKKLIKHLSKTPNTFNMIMYIYTVG